MSMPWGTEPSPSANSCNRIDPLVRRLAQGPGIQNCVGADGSDRALIVSRIRQSLKTPMVVVAADQKQMEQFAYDLSFFTDPENPRILTFPDYNLLPFKRLSFHSEIAAERIRTLFHLTSGGPPPLVVTTVGAMMHCMVPKKELVDYAELIEVNEDIDLDGLLEKLAACGYIRTGIVEEPGDFCLRGGILDIFSPMYSDPLRIELFGDMVESIRLFSALSQRKLKDLDEAVILPAKEIILKKTDLPAVISRIREQAAILELSVTRVREIVNRIASEGIYSELESMISLVYPKSETLADYFPENTLCILADPNDLSASADRYERLTEKNYSAAVEEKRLCIPPEKLYVKWPDIQEKLASKTTLVFEKVAVIPGLEKTGAGDQTARLSISDNSAVSMDLKQNRGKDHALLPLASWIGNRKEEGCRIFLVCHSPLQANRARSLLLPYGLNLPVYEDFQSAFFETREPCICIGQISAGFVWVEESLAFIKDDEIFGKKIHRARQPKNQVRTDLIQMEDLKKDDLVVHADHGIGRFDGLTKLQLNGTINDFLMILYRDDDRLYLPVDRMGLIQKYMGVDGIDPVLDKMGGKSWEKVKAKVKKSAEKIAGELLKLYAERKVKTGFAFEHLDEFYQDFESAFPYDETEDQLKAIDHVLQDMTDATPMDRLVCGDVGYGKTEVALRASFMAVSNGKQVAVLVPTTVLAEQHYATFCSRFESYGVKIACLSRFRSSKEQKGILENLAEGKIEIVIGTHRLLQKDVGFKSLGLFIIDEEHRFGVKHKEKLKEIRRTVDVLALTATPIPRTLHMSLLGIRDISLISTPPEFRRSIITYVCEFDDDIVAEAIRKEIQRNGQVYFVHNNINTIYRVADKIKKLVPEVRMDVAHGRMKEDELEDVMFKFVQKEIDLLVCTTIIESGLDIPSANTILVNRADRFGLAQIYQLRGRVGRSDEQAFAYLFIPRDSVLGKDAQKRLKVLMEHSDLGAGFQIAMSDLKIRGGGTILGASQSGHIAAVGYDMFLKLMEESVAEIKGEPVPDDLDPEINITISAFIPESYIADIDQRLSVYRRLARMSEMKEITDFRAEMTDRFGSPPSEAVNLLLKIMLKVHSKKAGIKRVDLLGQELQLFISETHQKDPHGLVEMIKSNPLQYQITPDLVIRSKLNSQNISGLLGEAKNILQEIARHVNPNPL
ncbi:MAG: transcription-repair coupling factor [Proteobacteria bacterium]|nr:transcription-repair coupling factor [Pseudomonadota bacterium]MBU4470395.1 transcription-repair coupling factor [Pseudomonadota bacterium]MCG2753930.1 transcription-repair coupling factor [Desulfobacteraceae bacterium]